MRLLWLARFDIAPTGLEAMQEILEKWLRSPKREPEFNGPFQVGDFRFGTGGFLQVDQSAESDAQEWAMRYERPVPGQGMVWVTEVSIQKREQSLDVTARLYQRSLGIGRPHFDRIVCYAPGFVFALRKSGLLEGQNRFWVDKVESAGVERFVQEIFSKSRRWPLVAVTVEPYSERPLLDPKALQDELIGVAQVVELSKRASLSLPKVFEQLEVPKDSGRIWGVYGGAVKVYRSRAETSQTPFDHPIWFPADVSSPDFAATLKEWCWSLSALEAPRTSHGVDAIRSARVLSESPSSDTGFTLEEEKDFLQLCLDEEEKRSNEWKRKYEEESERASELAERILGLESKNQALQFQLSRKQTAAAIGAAGTSIDEIQSAEEAMNRARDEFQSTLLIPANVAVDTSLDGPLCYSALLALHRLCELERRGQATNKRQQLRDLLNDHLGAPKDTYKCADTGIFIDNPETGEKVHLRERVHLKEGKPAETESIYWQTIGQTQGSYRYLVGRLGRHA